MTNTSTDIIMRRVRTIYFIRPLLSGAMAALLVLLAALYGIGREVWVAKVFQNAPSDALDFVRFFLTAFEHTEFVVQALTLLTAVAVLWLFRDIGKLALGIRAF